MKINLQPMRRKGYAIARLNQQLLHLSAETAVRGLGADAKKKEKVMGVVQAHPDLFYNILAKGPEDQPTAKKFAEFLKALGGVGFSAQEIADFLKLQRENFGLIAKHILAERQRRQ